MCRTQRKGVPSFSFSLKWITKLLVNYTKIIETQVGVRVVPALRLALFRMFDEFGFEAVWNSGDTLSVWDSAVTRFAAGFLLDPSCLLGRFTRNTNAWWCLVVKRVKAIQTRSTPFNPIQTHGFLMFPITFPGDFPGGGSGGLTWLLLVPAGEATLRKHRKPQKQMVDQDRSRIDGGRIQDS